ncbi:hypothetical protein [Curtobacterium flaccumfaciens]|uniref:hypothetical protein n=1 Tax=Curtobacterium flaccumfaciens TaxID=2035 RepID=UPI003D9A9B4C
MSYVYEVTPAQSMFASAAGTRNFTRLRTAASVDVKSGITNPPTSGEALRL